MSGAPKRGRATGDSDRAERLRLGLATALTAAAAGHVPVLTEHLREAPWMGWLFVLFIGAALGAATGTLLTGVAWPSTASIVLAAAAITTYCAARLFPLPQLADDVGDWSDPWGLASIALELAALVIAVQLRRRTRRPLLPAHLGAAGRRS